MPPSDVWSPSETATRERPQRPKRPDREGQQRPDPLDDLTAALDRGGAFTPDLEAVWSQILAMMRTESRWDPADFGRRMLDEAVAFAAFLAARGRHCLASRLADWDRARRAQGLGGPDPVLDDRDLPRLVELERHLADLIDARASVERRWALARRNGLTRPAPAIDSSESKTCPEAEPPDEPPHSGTAWGPFDV